MEADFTQYYQADLRDLWRPDSGMTVRWVIVHLMELPDDSRIKKHYGGEHAIFSLNDHLTADIRDLLLNVQYFTAVGALKDMKQSQIQKIVRGSPERPPRPGEIEPEPKFATKEELLMLFPDKAARRRLQRKRQMNRDA